MQQYLIAKYVDDIRRNEPINVGVILFDGGAGVAARFRGKMIADALIDAEFANESLVVTRTPHGLSIGEYLRVNRLIDSAPCRSG